MTGTLRGKTLGEKRYGEGFRPEHLQTVKAPWAGCAVDGCADPVHGSVELFVDDTPPALDWYSKLLAKLPPRAYVECRFCAKHLEDVVQRSVYEFQDEPDLWAPWRASPPVLPRPPKLIPRPLIVPGG
jgi:hypothetical protein